MQTAKWEFTIDFDDRVVILESFQDGQKTTGITANIGETVSFLRVIQSEMRAIFDLKGQEQKRTGGG